MTSPVPAEPATPAALADRIARAIGDPGSIVGRKFGPSWGEGNDGYAEHEETVTRWSTRAVLAVVAEVRSTVPAPTTWALPEEPPPDVTELWDHLGGRWEPDTAAEVAGFWCRIWEAAEKFAPNNDFWGWEVRAQLGEMAADGHRTSPDSGTAPPIDHDAPPDGVTTSDEGTTA